MYIIYTMLISMLTTQLLFLDKQNTTQAGSHVNKTYPALAQSLFGHSRQLRPEALSKNSEERNPHTIFSVRYLAKCHYAICIVTFF